MSLHLETGHFLTKDVQKLDAQSVRFVTDDGRTMFEVTADDDGRSIVVRGVEMTKHGDTVYGNVLLVEPHASNVAFVRTKEYGP